MWRDSGEILGMGSGHPFMAYRWFGEVSICCCLPLLPQLACKILATTYKYHFRAQYLCNCNYLRIWNSNCVLDSNDWLCENNAMIKFTQFKLLHGPARCPYVYTGREINTCTSFVEVCSCCCLPLLPQLVCNILPTMYKNYFRAQ